MMFFRSQFTLILASILALRLPLQTKGSITTTITVGQLGTFYQPAFVSAEINDTITFVFDGPFHTVTQSTADAPCVPLQGGFNSGVAGRGTNFTTAPAPTWSLTITNETEPIWFFCEITTPASHCASGMVGVINPPSIPVYMSVVAAAKAVTGTASPVPTLALTGVGAFATLSPALPPGAVTSSASTTDTSTPSTSSVVPSSDSSTPTPTASSTAAPAVAPLQSSTKSHLGAIVGGAVGGVVGIVIVLFALVWCTRQKKADRHRSTTSDDSQFFRYNVPVRRPSDAFRAAKAMENSSSSAVISPYTAATPPTIIVPGLSVDGPGSLAPNRRGAAGTPPPQSAHPQSGASVMTAISPSVEASAAQRRTSFRSQATSGLREQTSSRTLNMQDLANEVAQVLLRSPSGTALGQPPPNIHEATAPRPLPMHIENGGEEDRRASTPQAPPAYRSIGSPSAAPKAKLQRE